MDPDVFATTIGAMVEISSAIQNYFLYAKILIEEKSTSPLALVASSLKKFYRDVFVNDFKQIYE